MMTKKISLSLILVLFLSISVEASTESDKRKIKTSPSRNDAKLQMLVNDVSILKNSIKEVRRGQLNYELEKDLLKETYSSNLQTINVVITIVLATFTVLGAVLGFLGLKSITNLKEKLVNDLAELTKLRTKFEDKFTEIEVKVKDVGVSIEAMTEHNNNQDIRLQTLEIQEKATAFIQNKDYERALQYIEVGLANALKDITLLEQKAFCLVQVGNPKKGIETYEEIAELEPDDLRHAVNLIELYRLTSEESKYETLVNKYKNMLIEKYGKILFWYLDALKIYILNDLSAIREHIDSLSVDQPDQKKEYIKNWNYIDARALISEEIAIECQDAIKKIFNFLEGKLSYTELRKE